ncbi:hypothetical protein GOBAR_AA00682 [Gossypium barbadense]|uniref:Uncharacterized protein n=1 Tax=Gossypium barbadense TaxID=3634 RepID=A0A2P5YWC0_GOSBA|nr:hypothetical protein GOBAR_AA00682 [Gossypium barbadense]
MAITVDEAILQQALKSSGKSKRTSGSPPGIHLRLQASKIDGGATPYTTKGTPKEGNFSSFEGKRANHENPSQVHIKGMAIFKSITAHYAKRIDLQLPASFWTAPVNDAPLIPLQGGAAQLRSKDKGIPMYDPSNIWHPISKVKSTSKENKKMTILNEDDCTKEFDNDDFANF